MAETLHARVVSFLRTRDEGGWASQVDDEERAKFAHELISMVEEPSRPFEISSPTSDAWDFQALELARDAIGGQGAAWLGQLKARVQIAIIDGMRQASAKTAVTTRAEEIARVLRICEQYLQGDGGEVWIVRRIMAAIQGRRPLGHDAEKCIACDSPLRNGDLYYPDADGGSLHADCAGPDREGYTKGDGEPLGPNDPIPKPSVWMDGDATTAQPAAPPAATGRIVGEPDPAPFGRLCVVPLHATGGQDWAIARDEPGNPLIAISPGIVPGYGRKAKADFAFMDWLTKAHNASLSPAEGPARSFSENVWGAEWSANEWADLVRFATLYAQENECTSPIIAPDLRAKIAALIEDAMSESTVDYPAGHDAGPRVQWEEDRLLDGIMAAVGKPTTIVFEAGATFDAMPSLDELAEALRPAPNPSPAAKSGEAEAVERDATSFVIERLRQRNERYQSNGGVSGLYLGGDAILDVDAADTLILERARADAMAARLVALATPSPQPATPRDVLDQDKINALPLPLIARFASDKDWLPIHDIGVDAPLCRIDVSGKLEPRRFSEIMELKDGDGVIHNPDDFYLEEPAPSPQPADAVREALEAAADRAWVLAKSGATAGQIAHAVALTEPAPAGKAVEAGSERCPHCDGTGDVHRADGEWMGECDCAEGRLSRLREDLERVTRERDTFADICLVVSGHLELPHSESGPCDDSRRYDRALEASDILYRQTEAARAEHMDKRFKAEAEAETFKRERDEFKAKAEALTLHLVEANRVIANARECFWSWREEKAKSLHLSAVWTSLFQADDRARKSRFDWPALDWAQTAKGWCEDAARLREELEKLRPTTK